MAEKKSFKAESSKEKKKKVIFDHHLGVNILEKFIDFAKKKMTEKALDFSIKWVSRIGHFGLLAVAALGFLFAFIVAIRSNSFNAFLYGCVWIIVVMVIQYTAQKFSKAGEKLIKNNPAFLSSKAFMDCIGFLALIGGVILLVISFVQTVQGAGIQTLIIGILWFFLLEFFSFVAFNPGSITMNVGKGASAGQEAIGIVVFFLKGAMKLIPIAFGIGIFIGFILLFIDFIGVFSNEFRVTASCANARTTATQIVFIGLLPFLSYIFFVLFYLAIDVIRAILAVPGKLDEVIKKLKS